MPGPLSGPGIGLPLPQNLYPSELQNAPYDTPTNRVALAPGESLVIPAGDWYISLGLYLVLQYRDPVTDAWHMSSSSAYDRGISFIKSDGFSVRIANLLGCPVGAVVAALGSSYVQASTTITATPGNSTWSPIIGGALAFSGGTVTAPGAGYGVAPIMLIPAPPGPVNNANGVGGVPASGWCTIASGTISAASLSNPGAGYPTAPIAVIVPSPFDPNLSTGITQGTVTFTLTNAGALTGAICTNSGAPLATTNGITLTVAGAGSNASLTAISLQTVTTASVSTAGNGYGTISALLTTVGGVPPQGSIANPNSMYLAWLPRPAQIGLSVAAVGTLSQQTGAIYDGGLFLTNSTPNYIIVTQPTSQNTVSLSAGVIALTMGGVRDIALLQPAP